MTSFEPEEDSSVDKVVLTILVRRKVMIIVPRKVNKDWIQMEALTNYVFVECDESNVFTLSVCSNWGASPVFPYFATRCQVRWGPISCSSRFCYQMSGPMGVRVGAIPLHTDD